LTVLLAVFLVLILGIRIGSRYKKVNVVGLFHPYCNAGGGGERVLWCVVQALQSGMYNVVIFARANDCANPGEVISRAESRFNVKVDATRLRFIPLYSDKLLEAETYARLTLFGQSVGSMLVGMEAMWKMRPDVWIDTMGYSFIYPIAWCCGCRVGSYTHYPTMSTDMVRQDLFFYPINPM